MEIAVIGKSEFTTGFRLAGIRKIYDVSDDKGLEDKVKACLSDENEIGRAHV